MKRMDVFLINAFTHNGKGGNPAGVVLNADNLSSKEKLEIAKSIGFSETAFVSRDAEVDVELSFFTTVDEIDFCGHATLAAFHVMHQESILTEGQYVQRTKAGLLSVSIGSDGHIVMAQRLPEYLGTLSYEAVAKLIGIEASLLASTRLPIEIVSTGLADIIIPVPQGYLDRIHVNETLTRDFCDKHEVIGIHAFELCDHDTELTASCRNFAPLVGISEEAATGSANGALACYITKHLSNEPTNHFTFEQGRAMGRLSRIIASVDSSEAGILSVMVGGFAKQTGLQPIPAQQVIMNKQRATIANEI